MSDHGHFPYKSINVFIDHNYLQDILETILVEIKQLSKEEQIEFSRTFRQNVKVFGFRNPTQAPLPLQVKSYVEAFEEKEEIIPVSLTFWTKINHGLAQKVKLWLEKKGWDGLELERNFNESEGFLSDWPDELTLEKLISEFNKDHPDHKFNENDIILMVLWISGKLPFRDSNI
jgi:hypothetical protein